MFTERSLELDFILNISSAFLSKNNLEDFSSHSSKISCLTGTKQKKYVYRYNKTASPHFIYCLAAGAGAGGDQSVHPTAHQLTRPED
jgi:hypothetical protein